MRNFLAAAALAALCLGCNPKTESPAGGGSAPLARWHFVGTDALARDTNATHLRTVLAQPTTQALLHQALNRLAAGPAGAPAAPATRGLLDDLLKAESYAEFNQPAEWTFAVRLPADRARLWPSNWPGLARALGFAQSDTVVLGEWVVAGMADGPLNASRAIAKRIQQTRLPAAAQPGAWLEIEANLTTLAPTMGLPPSVNWPRARLTAAGRGANVRVEGRFQYDRVLDLTLEPWRIPTNTVREPLLAFTALQGVRPWFAERPALKELGVPPPNQVFAWSQSQVPYQTYYAWPMPDVAKVIAAAAPKLPAVAKRVLGWLNFGEIQYNTNTHRWVWQGFPLILPYVEAAPDPGFAVAGIFPVTNPGKPAPPELYAQVSGRTNLVYYHWEITQPRLADLEVLNLVYAMVAGNAPPATNSLRMQWLKDPRVTSQLGNSVTELTRVGPQELAGTRNASIGLTALELFQLLQWLEGANFPKWTPPDRMIVDGKLVRPAAPAPRQ